MRISTRCLILVLLLAGCPAPDHPRPVSPLAMIEASADLDGKVVGKAKTPTIVVLMASWCGHCKAELAELDALRAKHPTARILGVSYKGHEEYDKRGNAQQLRDFVAKDVPWLRVVPANEDLFSILGRPPTIPTIWVYNANGRQVAYYDRNKREPPTFAELDALLLRLGS